MALFAFKLLESQQAIERIGEHPREKVSGTISP
jgi:hypothetical protein